MAGAATAMGGGLWVGLAPQFHRLESRLAHAPPLGDPGWIRIAPDGGITLCCTLTEMGQGVWSALAQVVNEELQADPASIRVEMAPTWRAYASPVGFYTGGSSSIERLFTPLRRIGAAARIMLTEAAASRWGVRPGDCGAAGGYVVHAASGRRASYAELAAAAAGAAVPADPPLKPRTAWRSIGRSLPRLSVASKVNGTAAYGLDVRLPGLLVAAVAQSPWPAGRLASFDRQAALRHPGVLHVVDFPDTVAVVARDSWSAFRGLRSAAVRWRMPADPPDSGQLRAALLERLGPGQSSEPGGPGPLVQATYEVPLLMHMQLEPLNATARAHRFGAEVWAPTQAPARMQDEIARALFLPPPAVTVHATRVGGGFGRRLFTEEGVTAARIAGKVGAPVKAIWSREEDSGQDHFRPMAAARLEARLDATGAVRRVRVRIAGLGDHPRTAGLDPTPYRMGDVRVEYAGLEPPVRVGFWRSVDASQNVFFRECFIDECAHAAGVDPLAYRLRLLGDDHSRGRRVLETLAAAAGWQWPQGGSRFLGLAYHEGFGSLSAQAVEVSRSSAGALRVERIVVAVDCGTVVNPDGIRAQLEGGALFALSAALAEEATFVKGRLMQRNFDSYSVLRIAGAPTVDVRILETPDAPIGGMGEVGVPPLAPALANALFAATGTRSRRLPLSGAGVHLSAHRDSVAS
jgi:isoquinoline 1-oxidoreductase beta subunit